MMKIVKQFRQAIINYQEIGCSSSFDSALKEDGRWHSHWFNARGPTHFRFASGARAKRERKRETSNGTLDSNINSGLGSPNKPIPHMP